MTRWSIRTSTHTNSQKLALSRISKQHTGLLWSDYEHATLNALVTDEFLLQSASESLTSINIRNTVHFIWKYQHTKMPKICTLHKSCYRTRDIHIISFLSQRKGGKCGQLKWQAMMFPGSNAFVCISEKKTDFNMHCSNHLLTNTKARGSKNRVKSVIWDT